MAHVDLAGKEAHADGSPKIGWLVELWEDSAWETPIIDERLLYGVQPAFLSQALNCGDLRTIGGHRQHDARGGHRPVNQHGASAANPHAAAFLGARKAQIVAQAVDQQAAGWNIQLMFRAINFEANVLVHVYLL